jgi:hypothetical protein
LSPLSQHEIHEAVILSKDDAKKSYMVWVGDRKGILPYPEMAWALTVKPTSNAWKRRPSDLLSPEMGPGQVKESPKFSPLFLPGKNPWFKGPFSVSILKPDM